MELEQANSKVQSVLNKVESEIQSLEKKRKQLEEDKSDQIAHHAFLQQDIQNVQNEWTS